MLFRSVCLESCAGEVMSMGKIDEGEDGGAASKLLTKGFSICCRKSCAPSCVCLEACAGEVMSRGKIDEGEDGGAEACEEVEVGNMYDGIYVTG